MDLARNIRPERTADSSTSPATAEQIRRRLRELEALLENPQWVEYQAGLSARRRSADLMLSQETQLINIGRYQGQVNLLDSLIEEPESVLQELRAALTAIEAGRAQRKETRQ